MRLNYKRIGDYIHKVENRNLDLKVNKLLGLSMTKEFRETTSNIVGTDMSVYKIINKGQFACDFMSVIRVNKLPVVLKTDDEPCLVSPAYPVFEVNDKNELDPEYLMMWFRRSEFDRYAVFKCDSAIRGGYDWEELCNTLIPVPHIDKQKEIVKEYNVIINRIELNNKLIYKLEETAQSVYKEWFVDFEFPDENGKPYKSNSGIMIFNEEHEKEIPKGWESGNIETIANQLMGFAFKGEDYSFINGITVLRGENVSEQHLRWDTLKKWNKPLDKKVEKCFLEINDIVIGMDGSKVGKNWAMISKYDLPLLLAQRVSCLRTKKPNYELFLYYSLVVLDFEKYISQVQTGTSIPHISGKQIFQFPLLVPKDNIVEQYNTLVGALRDNCDIYKRQNITLKKLRDILLSKLATIEN